MRVRLEFVGQPFSREAVVHTLRHLAMHVGWQLVIGDLRADKRIVYATTDDPNALKTTPDDIVILSSRRVTAHLADSREPIPTARTPDRDLLPFPYPASNPSANWICFDVIAGAYATLNLWYEQKTRTAQDGWITWREDWMAKVGLAEPTPVADQWLDEIARAAARLGWSNSDRLPLVNAKFTVVLTHDVDYMPGPQDHGLPRLGRAVARQIVLRRNVGDALRLLARYVRLWSREPYFPFEYVMHEERKRGACSSFQIVPAHRHRFDPHYDITRWPLASTLREIAVGDWEICLHSSYRASRTDGQLEKERGELERNVGVRVIGHRQHYLNFSPAQLFAQVEQAGLKYDLSVGYNDRSGPRAGTYLPYRPYNHNFWEIPFVLMDTTLATTYRFSSRQALEHAQAVLDQVARAGGCVSVIWHLEQLSGLIDPGFDRIYYDLLDWICSHGGELTTGRQILENLEARWNATLADD